MLAGVAITEARPRGSLGGENILQAGAGGGGRANSADAPSSSAMSAKPKTASPIAGDAVTEFIDGACGVHAGDVRQIQGPRPERASSRSPAKPSPHSDST
jgi:hypothetical protein